MGMTVLNIPKTLRAAAVAVALAGSSFMAAPAVQAQNVDLDFRFRVPGLSFSFGDDDRNRRGFCMNAREVRRDLRGDGYREIRFLDRRGRIVHLTAELRRPGRDRDYRIAYDTCRGRIIDRDRIV
jgi:hypothetical protein